MILMITMKVLIKQRWMHFRDLLTLMKLFIKQTKTTTSLLTLDCLAYSFLELI